MSEQETQQEAVQETVISQEIFNPENIAAIIGQVGAQIAEPKSQSEPKAQPEPSEPAPETERLMAGFVIGAEESTEIEPAPEYLLASLEGFSVPQVVEKIINPEVGVTREKIDHKILTSHIKNPA